MTNETNFAGWLTTSQASHMLAMNDTSVRYYIKNGVLDIMQTPLGLLVSKTSVQRLAEMRQLRRANGTVPARATIRRHDLMTK